MKDCLFTPSELHAHTYLSVSVKEVKLFLWGQSTWGGKWVVVVVAGWMAGVWGGTVQTINGV